MLTRRHLMAASAASLAAGVMPARAQADWPNRPVRLIIPSAAGGAADFIVTGDKDLLALAGAYPILSPAEFEARFLS